MPTRLSILDLAPIGRGETASDSFTASVALALVPGSVSAFQDDINPGLKKAYGSVGAAFVDVTKATGADGPFLATIDPTFGQIPVPVAKVCTLTYFCDGTFNIHMKTPGYHIIAALEAKTLPNKIAAVHHDTHAALKGRGT